MTERLFYCDSYCREFTARVVAADDSGTRVELDRTAFYATSGGQPNDLGTLNGIAVTDVVEEEDRIIHVLAAPLAVGQSVEGRIDWARRFDHMQQHSGQHLLSAVFDQLCQAPTVSFHLGADSSTIDLNVASLSDDQLRAVECRANQAIVENHAVSVAFEEAAEAVGLRKQSSREGTLRIVTIDGVDRSACGGTHVRFSGEIGPILLRKSEKIRGTVRIEFLCGSRAVARARADFEALLKISRLFSSTFDDAPKLVAAQLEQARETERVRRKLALELALARGRDLYAQAEPDATGIRRQRLSGALDDETRAVAQGFCAQPKAVFIATGDNPPALLLAASADSGIHAGNALKQALAAVGGRGGGNAALAQGSVASAEALAQLVALLS